MARFDYECQESDCQFSFEMEHAIKARRPRKCPMCERQSLERVILTAPLGFVRGNVTTIGQQAELNAKKLGRYGSEEKSRRINEEFLARRNAMKQELAKRMPKGITVPKIEDHKPWYGKLSNKMKKHAGANANAKIHHYIQTGEERL